METILAIETSTRVSGVALWRQGQIIYDSASEATSIDGFDLSAMTQRAFDAAGVAVDQLDVLAVDIGPGGLNAVRAGVTFANGLATSLDIPIVAVSSLLIMGFEAQSLTNLPVVCVRGATTQDALLAIYDRGEVQEPVRGSIAQLKEHLQRLHSNYAVAGRYRKALIAEVGASNLVDSGVEHPTAAALLSALAEIEPRPTRTKAPVKITYPEGKMG